MTSTTPLVHPSGEDRGENRSTLGLRDSHTVASDVPFYIALMVMGGFYVVMLVGILVADMIYLVRSDAHAAISLSGLEWARPLLRPALAMLVALGKPEIRYSIQLTLISCLLSALLSLVVAVPLGYGMSRYRFPGRVVLDALLDIPIVLPPLVVGLSLLILFQLEPFRQVAGWFVFQVPGVILAQFMVAAAFAIRTMRATFDQMDPRQEQVALTLGCTQAQAFTQIAFPRATLGIVTAGTLAWARSLGEFGPLLVFAGATRNKTEVLSTTVFLELSIGNLEAAVAVSLLMVGVAVVVLVLARLGGVRNFLM